jgi:hypothetical protein
VAEERTLIKRRIRRRSANPFPYLPMAVLLWSALAHADHTSLPLLGLGLRAWSVQTTGVRVSDVSAESVSRPPSRFPLEPWALMPRESGFTLAGMSPGSFEIETPQQLLTIDDPMLAEASIPPTFRFTAEPHERRLFDFQRRCLNPCPLGGWGSCVLDTNTVQSECEGIAGRTLVSAAIRRTPVVRDALKLLGSRAVRVRSDFERGVRLSAALIGGGGTLGVEARW